MKLFILTILSVSVSAFAADDIDVKVGWLENVAKGAVIEVCGTAISKTGKWPLIVSIVHGESTFSTVTNKEGKYCQLIGRQNFKGIVNVNATSMDGQSFGFSQTNIK